MAPNHLGITDSRPMGVPSRHFSRWQILMAALVVLAVVSGAILGLSQDSARPAPQFPGGISEADLKVNPTPDLAVTPIPTPATPLKIDVQWATGGPPVTASFAGPTTPISSIIIESESIAYARIDPFPGKYIIWKTEDGGKTWQETKDEKAATQFPTYSTVATSFFWANRTRSETEKELREKLDETFDLRALAPPFGEGKGDTIDAAVDQTNGVGFATAWNNTSGKVTFLRFFVSLNRGKTWTEISAPLDPKFRDISALAAFSADDQLKVYAGSWNGQIWQATISLKSLSR